MRNKTLYLFLLINFFCFAQKKTYNTQRTTSNIIIDGKSNEKAWEDIPIATDFVTLEPDNGNVVAKEKRTEVKILYDNNAVYISAKMFDNEPEKIMKEIVQRDNFGTADIFGIFINGFNDNQQDFQFFVTAANVQNDTQASDTNGEDSSWDAVWTSKAIITSFGWEVEMKIPYAALRFSNASKQTWGINLYREIRRDRQKYTWNFIDAKISSSTQQAGLLTGIENIKPPTRLFLLPYSSFYANANGDSKTKGTLKGGLDIKYGINDAFTLDAILIPDFGQARFDDQILNLGPFEQQFNENRAFFTEGTDLFSKGNLFYSRRIGGAPTGSLTLNTNEIILENPSTVSLINALKVSGRTKNGLGIGVLNAVTEQTFGKTFDTTTGEIRKQIIEPLSNYNVFVFDQRFRKNSSVSFINTNVTRNGNFRDANVSALIFDLNTKANTYGLSGDVKQSYVNNIIDKNGTNASLRFAKTSGKYRYTIASDIMTKNFDIDDLGIINETNYYSTFSNVTYRILKPTKTFNSFSLFLGNYNQFNLQTNKPQTSIVELEGNFSTKKNHFMGFGINANPVKEYDYYEPRIEGRYFIIPERINAYIYLSTNFNYKFAFDFNPKFAKANEMNRNFWGVTFGPRYRFSDKLLVTYKFDFNRRNNNRGYVAEYDTDNNVTTPNDAVMATRNVVTYSNNIGAKYALNSNMTFNLNVRQYWSYAKNSQYLILNPNGTVSNLDTFTQNKNSNFNSWNMDLSYVYWFAPGSQISILYRNNAATSERTINKDFSENVSGLLNNDRLSHVFSISVRYFIDYNQVKNNFKNKNG